MLEAVLQTFEARGLGSAYTMKQLEKSIENRINNYKRQLAKAAPGPEKKIEAEVKRPC